MSRPRAILCVLALLCVRDGRGQDGPPVGAAEKRVILGLLTGPDAASHIDRLALMGPRILPVLLEVVTSDKHGQYDRAQVFRVVRKMQGVRKDEFVTAAAQSLAKDEGTRFATAAVRLIEDSKESKYAPSVCGLLIRMANESDPEDLPFGSEVIKALVATGTREELKLIEEWLTKNPLGKDLSAEAAKRFGKGRELAADAAKQLRAKLKK